MIGALKTLAKSYLRHRKAHPTPLTDAEKISNLLYRLRPIAYAKELIRLGPQGDGGYLVADDLAGIKACFSPGVGLLSGFEKDCADRGMDVFLADKSVAKPSQWHDRFSFTPKYVGVTRDDDFMTLDDWVLSSCPDPEHELLLQMDVEGFEYEILLAASDQLLNRCRIIIVEFHWLNELWNQPFFKLAGRVFDKLLQTHSCVHNHPNNCCGIVKNGALEIPVVSELTFVHNRRIDTPSFVDTFPHPLDCDNISNLPSIVLPTCWYKSSRP